MANLKVIKNEVRRPKPAVVEYETIVKKTYVLECTAEELVTIKAAVGSIFGKPHIDIARPLYNKIPVETYDVSHATSYQFNDDAFRRAVRNLEAQS